MFYRWEFKTGGHDIGFGLYFKGQLDSNISMTVDEMDEMVILSCSNTPIIKSCPFLRIRFLLNDGNAAVCLKTVSLLLSWLVHVSFEYTSGAGRGKELPLMVTILSVQMLSVLITLTAG